MMDRSASTLSTRATLVVRSVLFGLLCLWPHLGRLRYPSMYGDDVVRMAAERVEGTRKLLFRPFNEHMAPVFQALSAVCRLLAGDDLMREAVVLTWMSYVPFLILLLVLFFLVRGETKSLTAALIATAAFSISWLHVETIDWYSASSFTWSLLGSLVAWRAVARAIGSADRRVVRFERVIAALAAGLAPACSAIGLIAGPLASLRAIVVDKKDRAWKTVVAPWFGTVIYLGITLAHGYGDHVATNVKEKGNVRQGMFAIAIAPAEVLIPALFGVKSLHGKIPAGLAVAATMLLTLGAILWSIRSRYRALILGGLALIFGGYALTYLVRASVVNIERVLEVQRYHLLPQMGLCFILGAVVASFAARLDARPAWAWTIGLVAALALNLTHDQEIRARSNFYRYPDQMRSLATIDRLAAFCRRERISRPQALRVLGNVLTKWFPYEGWNQLELLPPTVDDPALSDAAARARILGAFGPDELEALLGGLDASKAVVSVSTLGPTVSVAKGVPKKLFRVREVGPGRYVSLGWPSYVEYEMKIPKDVQPPRYLKVEGGVSGEFMLPSWNAADDNHWSEVRSARVKASAEQVEGAWALPLDALPHWRAERSRRFRIGIQSSGPFRLKSVELTR